MRGQDTCLSTPLVVTIPMHRHIQPCTLDVEALYAKKNGTAVSPTHHEGKEAQTPSVRLLPWCLGIR